MQSTNIEELIKRLPKGYEEACYETKAIERVREIKTPIDLMRLVLIYLTGGHSQLEMSVIASQLGIADIADTAFLKKFAKCRGWLEWIVSKIIPKPIVEYSCPKWFESYTITAIDASDVTEKGRSKRVFRLHYAIDIMKMRCLSFKLTAQKTGETLLNFSVQKGWLILADRIYGTLTGIEHCLKAGANFVIRLRYGAFKLYDCNGTEINLLEKLQHVTSDTAISLDVYVKLSGGLTKLRVCATKIPNDKLEALEKRNKRKASKKQRTASIEALIMTQYVVLITALPDTIPATEITSLYRFRWQVEIYFKRLKSIIDFGNVPLRREDSIFTWLNGKLLVSILIEQMIGEVSFSP